jgi:hypothetical protein
MDRLAGGVRVQPCSGRQPQLIGPAPADEGVGGIDRAEWRTDLAEKRPERDLPGRRPGGVPEIVGQIGLRYRLVNRDQPNEDPSDLATRECPFGDDSSVRANKRDSAGEIDAKRRRRLAFTRQRFPNHAS